MANSGTFYLVVKPRPYNGLAARLTSKKPSVDSNEVALKLVLSVPSAIFTRPQLEATVSIPDSAVTPSVLPASVLDNVREVLQQQTGLDLTIRVVEGEQ